MKQCKECKEIKYTWQFYRIKWNYPITGRLSHIDETYICKKCKEEIILEGGNKLLSERVKK